MSRAVLRVVAYGSRFSFPRTQPVARSRANATLCSNVRRFGPAERRNVSVDQSQRNGVLRPTNRGSMPIRRVDWKLTLTVEAMAARRHDRTPPKALVR
jgi:hypothetical protein